MSASVHPLERFHDLVEPAISSKIEEFRLFGYDKVTNVELWEYLVRKKWKKASDDKRLFEVVGDILSVKVGDYMSYATIEAFKSPDMFGDDFKGALEGLI